MKHKFERASSTAVPPTMRITRQTIVFVAGSGVLFCLDQWLKFLARTNTTFSWYFIKPYLGWEYFENTGIAFSLPFPQLFLIGITPLLLLWFFFMLKKHLTSPTITAGICLVVFGAVSNFIDRIIFGVTIDYLRILNGILNIADFMIAAGIIMIVFSEYKKKPEPRI